MNKAHIFVSYCRSDINWVKEGEYNLIPWIAKSLKNKGITVWYDKELKKLPGEEYKKIIKTEIDRADLAILLISQEFINSEFIRKFEMPWIRERIERNELAIIPILVGRTLWEYEYDYNWLKDRQMLIGEEAPLIDYSNNRAKWDEARTDILRAILNTANKRQDQTTINIPRQPKDNHISAFGKSSNRVPETSVVLGNNQPLIIIYD